VKRTAYSPETQEGSRAVPEVNSKFQISSLVLVGESTRYLVLPIGREERVGWEYLRISFLNLVGTVKTITDLS
jgi:hypothetical protein